MGGHVSIWQQFLSTAGLVGVINSALTAASIGLRTFNFFDTSLIMCITAGIVMFAGEIFTDAPQFVAVRHDWLLEPNPAF
jgi:hypothetical protein